MNESIIHLLEEFFALRLQHRQAQVAMLVCRGLTSQQIGKRLDISESTVKTHLERIYTKLDVYSRTEMVALALGISEGVSHGG